MGGPVRGGAARGTENATAKAAYAPRLGLSNMVPCADDQRLGARARGRPGSAHPRARTAGCQVRGGRPDGALPEGAGRGRDLRVLAGTAEARARLPALSRPALGPLALGGR